MLPTLRAISAIALLVMLSGGCSAGEPKPQAGPTRRTAAGPCASTVTRDALPSWARTGFRGGGVGVPHVLSEHGDLIAVLFDYPPKASSDPNVANKILWVSRLRQQAMQPLRIDAALSGTKTSVVREIAAGPGPSMVNLPKTGCWQLALSWSGHTDAMTLRFK